MTSDTVCFCPSEDPMPLAFNHNYISTQRYISHSSKSDSRSARSNKRLTKDLQKNISWIVVVCIVAAVSLSNIAYAGKQPANSLMLSGLSMNLGGPEEGYTIPGILSVPGGYTGDILHASIIPPAQSSLTQEESEPQIELPVLNVLNASAGYTEEETRVVRTYTVQEGETLNEIADRFGISAETIAIANDLDDLNKVEVNTVLTILPVDGIQINLTEDERSIEELARVYQVSEEVIREFNTISGDDMNLASLIIPDAVVPNTEKPFYVAPPVVRVASNRSTPSSNLPELRGFYSLPTTGHNYGRIHSTNGVDVANSCGTPIVASAAGVVTTSRDGWNGGYGTYIIIQHDNGTQTLYAHLSQRNAQVGQSVAQNELIGLMGTTGRSTGCHLHFEVRGARNPLAR